MTTESQAAARAWWSEAQMTVRLAVPLTLTNLAQAAIPATNVVLLARLGAHDLAAGTLGANVFFVFLIFGMGLVMAASPMIARELGASRHNVGSVRRIVQQTTWAALTLSIPVWLILWHTEGVLLAFGQDPLLAEKAGSFVRALQWAFLPALCYLILRSFVAALERPGWALLVGVGGVLVNALLGYGFIFGRFGLPRMGLVGAGVSSTLTQIAMLVAMCAVVMWHPSFRRFRLFGKLSGADWPRYRRIWRIGAPIGAALALEATSFSAAVLLMGFFGAASLAAHAIAIQISSLSLMIPLGVGQAATVRVGLAYGRRDAVGIGRAGWTALVLGVGFMCAAGVLMITEPRFLVSLFLDPSDPSNAEVVRLAIVFISIAALFQVADGAQAVGAGVLRGLHDTTIPMLYAAVGYWVIGLGSAVALGFGAGWQGAGIWSGLAVGLGAVAILMIVRWCMRHRLGLV